MIDGHRNINLVVIDDDEQFLDLNKDMLERTGKPFEIKATTEPEDIVDWVGSGRVDAVISDYDMPKIDGGELLEDVREIDGELPFFLLTGRKREELSEEDLEKATGYYQKDGNPETYEKIAGDVANGVGRYRKLQAAGEVVGNHNGPVILINNEQNVAYANEYIADVIDKELQDIIGEDISAINVPEMEGRLSEEKYDEALSEGSYSINKMWKDDDITYGLNLTSVSGYDGIVAGTLFT